MVEAVFDDTPREVFSHYQELEKMGLAAPQITYIMHALKEKGLDVDVNAINCGRSKRQHSESTEEGRKGR